jgi:dihydroneopterin aldolase
LLYDNIIIKNLKIYAHHGVLPEEKQQGQIFYLDITLFADLSEPCYSDDVEDTVNYDEVCNCANRIMTQNNYDLIERAAQAVCDGILGEFPRVEQIELTLKKPDAPVKCDIEYAAVKICRKRGC